MAYIGAKETAQIRKKLKAKFPDWKFSVVCRHHTGVDVSIMAGPVDFYNEKVADNSTSGVFHKCLESGQYVNVRKKEPFFTGNEQARGHKGINHYFCGQHGKYEKLFKEILEIILYGSDRKWFDDSDSQTDYFHTAFYVNMQVGKWDRPYEYKKG